jgi:heterodisulfide reductase subunit D
MHEAIDLLQHLPGIRYVELSDAERCCGAGGGALASMPDVPIALRTAKLQSVSAANVDCLIAPCPLCVLNLNLGIIDDYNKLNFKVEDITTFIKRYIK